jgi:hypothetical protein
MPSARYNEVKGCRSLSPFLSFPYEPPLLGAQ